MRFVLGVDDDHSEFLRRFADDPLLGRPITHLRGLRPMRTATVAHALLRAVAGQLITAREARAHERAVIRAATRALGGLHAAATAADLARFSPAELCRFGLGARRGATLIRLCRGTDLEQLKSLPTAVVAHGSSASAASGPGRPASSASRASAATSAASRATSGSSSSPRRSGDGGSRPRKPTRCSSPTGSGPGSPACISWRDTTPDS